MKYAKELLADGDTITVDDYNNPQYHTLANKFIKELGLSQKLYEEPKALDVQTCVTNDKPSNLSQLKKFLTVGMKVHVRNYYGETMNEKDTTVLAVQTNQIVFEKTLGSGIKSWFDLGKASEWIFTNNTAQKYYIDNKGQNKLGYEIVY